jgi:hypothetical protein
LAPAAFADGGVAPPSATPVQREHAQARFVKGREKFNKKDYAGALTEFSASLDIVTSPNTRLYVGRCHRELGHLVEAYVEFGRTEVEAKELSREDPRYEKAGDSAHDERTKLEPLLGFLNIDIAHPTDTTTLTVAGGAVKRAGWTEPVPVMPGKAEVVVETPDRPPIHRTIEVAAAEHKPVAIDAAESIPPPAPPPAPVATVSSGSPSSLRPVAYLTGGIAIVGVGLFTVFGLEANGAYSELKSACNSGPCPPGHEAQISHGRSEQTLANVGLVVGLVGAAATVTLWVLSTPKSSPASARVDVGPSFTGIRGTF